MLTLNKELLTKLINEVCDDSHVLLNLEIKIKNTTKIIKVQMEIEDSESKNEPIVTKETNDDSNWVLNQFTQIELESIAGAQEAVDAEPHLYSETISDWSKAHAFIKTTINKGGSKKNDPVLVALFDKAVEQGLLMLPKK